MIACNSGRHTWHEQLDAQRCCSPDWQRITLLPGERIRSVLQDPRICPEGINHAPDGFNRRAVNPHHFRTRI
jgi:hypothetical protein